ncbi:hypothetical protein P9239_18995 [Caballeronia sp. LZ062]|uniref:hypothetical protein n=1 Tax=unclassified Caballeronia TaxID=2646786 RepID=UPI002859D33E|nr:MULTISPECIES: hypothetical protein [unclassified Caballeronia]MDR5855775.1 hypothetical protein [Caballeronia sp. LZ050]MDR5872438.1 hypothetical protein [Caballeronia sp. LZ062]
MDIFYYWQKLEQNLRDGQVGYFGSNNTKILELKERLPKRVWVFKTPKGMKGSVQLLGALLVSDEPKVAVHSEYSHLLYYDPFSPHSTMFTDSDTQERIEGVTRLLQHRLLHAFKSNFQGDAGLQPLESNVVRELEALTGDWGKVQLLERVKDAKKVRPINPFARQPH